MSVRIECQLHGYRGGHQLLRSSVRLDRVDQDVVDYLSDMSGPLRPGEEFDAYISAYPLPSEDYYAVARTVQDMNATRAGCVLTRTLLVPMKYWEAEASPLRVARALERPIETGATEVADGCRACAAETVDDPVIYELVQALFLESRRATVVFGASQAEAIAFRLMAALWPGMRRTLSVCTFALSPRTTLGRSFDLLFAPSSARSRFSEWDGRRVESSKRGGGDRHRWAVVLSTRIFGDARPHLAKEDTIRVLASEGDPKNEGFLRLCLRWEELWVAVNRSPTAVLGLVDIVNSRRRGNAAWGVLGTRVVQGVDRAAAVLDTEVAWQFLKSLLEKLANRRVDPQIVEAVKNAGAVLTEREWSSALAHVSGDVWIDSRLGEELIRSVGRGISSVEGPEVTRDLSSVEPDRLVKMALLEERLIERFFARTDPVADAALVRAVSEGIRRLVPETRKLNMFRFLRYIRGDGDAEILEGVLSNVNGERLVSAVSVVWGLKSRRTRLVGEVLCSAAEACNSAVEVREALSWLGWDVETDRCISRLLNLMERDVEWVLESPAMGRRAVFLNKLVGSADDRDIERVFGRREIAWRALTCLCEEPVRFAHSAFRLVFLASVSGLERVSFGLKILPKTEGQERTRLAQSMFVAVLRSGTLQTVELRQWVIRKVAQYVDVRTAIDEVLGLEREGSGIARTLCVLDSVLPVTTGWVASHIRHGVELVTKRRRFDIGREGAKALASLLDNTKEEDPNTFVEICGSVLTFAMASRVEFASKIVVATFPRVYDELRNGKHLFLLGEFFDFFDWDRCKVARRELVRAFMKSHWPPVDLAIVADRSGDLVRVLRRVLKEPKGQKYMRRIGEGAMHIAGDDGERILSALDEVVN